LSLSLSSLFASRPGRWSFWR